MHIYWLPKLVAEGKRSTINTYLNEIKKSVEIIDDTGILDHTIVKLLPTVTSLRAHLIQPTDNDEAEFQSFEIKEKFPLLKRMRFSCNLTNSNQKKTKLPFK